MSRTFTLAANTFREAVRDRLLTTVLAFGAMMVLGAIVLAPLTLGEEVRVVRDLGLAAISLFSVLTIVLVGTGMVYREIAHRTIHTILTHPVRRAEFVVGKFLGLYGTIFFAFAVLSLVYLAVVALFGGGVQANLFVALGLGALEALVVTAIAIFFSTVASPLLSAVFTLAVVVAGHVIGSVRLLVGYADNAAIEAFVGVLYVVLPSLHQFGVRNNLLTGIPVPAEQLLWCAGYSLLYSGGLLVLTILAFQRRDFE
jgi:ABC-type transport system involved in multi-copper enzyme maturation permease subunit